RSRGGPLGVLRAGVARGARAPAGARSGVADAARLGGGGPGCDEQLAGTLEAVGRLEARELALDLRPRLLALGFAACREHLVQGSEGLASETQVLGGGRQAQGRGERPDLDVGE